MRGKVKTVYGAGIDEISILGVIITDELITKIRKIKSDGGVSAPIIPMSRCVIFGDDEKENDENDTEMDYDESESELESESDSDSDSDSVSDSDSDSEFKHEHGLYKQDNDFTGDESVKKGMRKRGRPRKEKIAKTDLPAKMKRAGKIANENEYEYDNKNDEDDGNDDENSGNDDENDDENSGNDGGNDNGDDGGNEVIPITL